MAWLRSPATVPAGSWTVASPLARAATLAGLAVLFAYAAFLNGYPFVFSDTGAYVGAGFGGPTPLDGTMAYGLWLRLGSVAGSLWLPALLQMGVLALLIALVMARFAPAKPGWKALLGTGLVLALTTSVSSVAGLLMPDVFLPIGLLSFGLFATSDRPAWERPFFLAIVLFASLTAFSTLCALTCVAGALAILGWRRWVSRRRALLGVAWMALCWLAVAGLNRASQASGRFSSGWKGYTLGTLARSGDLRRYLNATCASHPLPYCHGDVPSEPNAFLWSPQSAFNVAGGWGAGRAQGQVLRAFFSSPSTWPHWAGEASGRVLRQLTVGGVDPSVYAPVRRGSAPEEQVALHFPQDLPRLRAASQQRGLLGSDPVGLPQLALTLGGLIATLVWRKRLRRDQCILGGALLAGILGAAVCGAVVGMPFGPRSGARTLFLIPLFAFTTLADPLSAFVKVRRTWPALRERIVTSYPRFATRLRSVGALLHRLDLFYLATVVVLVAKLMLAHRTFLDNQPLPSVFYWFARGLWHLLSAGDPSALFGGVYLVTLGAVLLLTCWTLLLPRRAGHTALVVVNALVSVLALSDAVYWRYFHDFLSVAVVAQAGQVGELGDCILPLLRWTDLLFAADFAVVAYLAWRRRRNPSKVALPRRWASLRQFAVYALVGALAAVVPSRFNIARDPGITTNPWSRRVLYSLVGLVGLHSIEVAHVASEHLFRQPLPPERLALLRTWFSRRAQLRSRPTPLTGVAKGKNVIVVQMESFQDFVIGRKLGGVEITPNFNALLPQLLFLPNYYHQTAQGRTSDAEFASNCSLLPLDSGSAYIRYPNNHFVCLPKVLRDAGYDTAAFHGNNGTFYNRYYVYPRIGFNHFFDLDDFRMERTVGWALGDKAFFKQSVTKMKELHPPFYAFLITLSSHYPFHLPEAFQTLPKEALPPGMLADYLQAVHYLDAALGELVQELKAAGLWNDSVVFFYGDHDDGIPDDDPGYAEILGHPPTPVERMNLAYRVGLMAHLPNDMLAGRHDMVAGQTDLAPTVMDALGMDSSRLPWLGESVLSTDPAPLPLRWGAFASKDLLSLNSSTCIDRHSDTLVSAQNCEPLRTKALQRLDESEDVVSRDLQADLAQSISSGAQAKATQ